LFPLKLTASTKVRLSADNAKEKYVFLFFVERKYLLPKVKNTTKQEQFKGKSKFSLHNISS